MGAGIRASGYCNRPNVDGRGVVYGNCSACGGTGVLEFDDLVELYDGRRNARLGVHVGHPNATNMPDILEYNDRIKLNQIDQIALDQTARELGCNCKTPTIMKTGFGCGNCRSKITLCIGCRIVIKDCLCGMCMKGEEFFAPE